LESIKLKYNAYKELWERPIVETVREGNIEWYFQELHTLFLSVKESLNELIDLNDKMMYQTALALKNRSNRAIMPGVVAMLSALGFTFMFTYFVNYYMVSPIIKITERIERFISRKTPFDVKIETKDELYDLTQAIEHLCELSPKEKF
jgi:hypothetical protein